MRTSSALARLRVCATARIIAPAAAANRMAFSRAAARKSNPVARPRPMYTSLTNGRKCWFSILKTHGQPRGSAPVMTGTQPHFIGPGRGEAVAVDVRQGRGRHGGPYGGDEPGRPPGLACGESKVFAGGRRGVAESMGHLATWSNFRRRGRYAAACRCSALPAFFTSDRKWS